MKFSQLIENNMADQNDTQKCGGKTSLRHFFKKSVYLI